MQEREQEQSEVTEDASNQVEEVEQDSTDESESKIVKSIRKKQKAVKKAKNKAKSALIQRLQIIILILLLLLVFSWSSVEKVLNFLSGQEEIFIVSKTDKNGCNEVVTQEGQSYCVDKSSYDLVDTQGNYLLEEYQYTFILRKVD